MVERINAFSRAFSFVNSSYITEPAISQMLVPAKALKAFGFSCLSLCVPARHSYLYSGS